MPDISSPEVSNQLLEVVSPTTELTLAHGTNLRKIENKFVCKPIFYRDCLTSLAFSTEMVTNHTAKDRDIRLEPFETDLGNKILEGIGLEVLRKG